MTPDISERVLEDAIEASLLNSRYHKRNPEQYDRALCLLPQDVLDFVLATQPKAWKQLTQHHGAAVREQFLQPCRREIERRGALDVLRKGIKDSGCKFQLAYFRPASGLNEETRGCTRPISSPSCASSTTARATRTASTWCSS